MAFAFVWMSVYKYLRCGFLFPTVLFICDFSTDGSQTVHVSMVHFLV